MEWSFGASANFEASVGQPASNLSRQDGVRMVESTYRLSGSIYGPSGRAQRFTRGEWIRGSIVQMAMLRLILRTQPRSGGKGGPQKNLFFAKRTHFHRRERR